MYRYLLIVLLPFIFAACSIRKKSKHTEYAHNKTEQVSVIKDSSFTRKTKTVKDTVIATPARSITGTIKPTDFVPVYDDQGVTQSEKARIAGNGVQVIVNKKSDGDINITATCDSLQLVINGLITEVEEKSIHIDGLYQQLEDATIQEQAETVTKTDNGSTFFIIVIVCAIIFFIIKSII